MLPKEVPDRPTSEKCGALGLSLTGVRVNGNGEAGGGTIKRWLGDRLLEEVASHSPPPPTVLHRPGTPSAAAESPLPRAALPAFEPRAWPVTAGPFSPQGEVL